MRLARGGGRVLQEQRQVEVGLAFAVFPAQRSQRHHRLAFKQDGQVAEEDFCRFLLIQGRIFHQRFICQQRLALGAILLAELMPRLAVNIADFQRQLAGTQILILHFQALQAVIQLAINALAIFRQLGFTAQIGSLKHGHLFAFNGDSQLIEREFLIADPLIKVGQTAIALGFEVVEGELHFLAVLIDGIYQAACCVTFQRDVFAITIGIQLEIAAAEGHFFIAIFVIQCFQRQIGTRITGIADAGIGLERRLILRQIEQRF